MSVIVEGKYFKPQQHVSRECFSRGLVRISPGASENSDYGDPARSEEWHTAVLYGRALFAGVIYTEAAPPLPAARVAVDVVKIGGIVACRRHVSLPRCRGRGARRSSTDPRYVGADAQGRVLLGVA